MLIAGTIDDCFNCGFGQDQTQLNPIFVDSLTRLEQAEKTLRVSFSKLNGLAQILGGLPVTAIKSYNDAHKVVNPILQQRVDEYGAAGGDTSAEIPLPVITTAVKGDALNGATFGDMPEALKAIHKATRGAKDFVPADQLRVIIPRRRVDGRIETLSGTWEDGLALQAEYEQRAAHLDQLGFPVTLVVVLLSVVFVAAIVGYVISRKDAAQIAVSDAQSKIAAADAAMSKTWADVAQNMFNTCVGTTHDPNVTIRCMNAAAAAAERAAKAVPKPPVLIGKDEGGMSLFAMIGIAVVGTGVLVGGYYAYKHRDRFLRNRPAALGPKERTAAA